MILIDSNLFGFFDLESKTVQGGAAFDSSIISSFSIVKKNKVDQLG